MAVLRLCSLEGCGKPHKASGLCNTHHLRLYRETRSAWPICSAPDCRNSARSASASHCEMHYGRLRRNGTLERIVPTPVIGHSEGYRRVYARDHPLRAGKVGNYEYEHRVVFYREHGEGPFECHHCKAIVTWDDLHVDHLDDVTDNNDPSNLVASCPLCNQWRGRAKLRRTMKERHSEFITWNGATKTLSEWASDIGISRTSLKSRITSNWPLDRALTEPRGKSGPKS